MEEFPFNSHQICIVDSLRYFWGPLSHDTIPFKALEEIKASGLSIENVDFDEIIARQLISDPLYREQYFKAWRAAKVQIVHQTVGIIGSSPSAFDQLIREISYWWRLKTIADDITIIQNEKDIIYCRKNDYLGVILGTQDASFIDGDYNRLEIAYNLGLRIVQPTYNMMNDFGTGCTERVDAGLSYKGLELIKRLNVLGIVIDGSHCSSKTILEIIEVSKTPIILSHVTCKSVCPHDRGKTDEVLSAVAQQGGYIGIALVPAFLTTKSSATLDDFLAHLNHAIDVCGIDHVGIGTDWGAVYPAEIIAIKNRQAALQGFRPEHRLDYSSVVQGFENWTKWPNIVRALINAGYNLNEIIKILGENFLRVFKQIIQK